MKCALLLDIVVGQSATVLQLLAGKDESLLIGRDPFFVLDLGLDIVDRVRGLDLEGDRLTRKARDPISRDPTKKQLTSLQRSASLIEIRLSSRSPRRV